VYSVLLKLSTGRYKIIGSVVDVVVVAVDVVDSNYLT